MANTPMGARRRDDKARRQKEAHRAARESSPALERLYDSLTATGLPRSGRTVRPPSKHEKGLAAKIKKNQALAKKENKQKAEDLRGLANALPMEPVSNDLLVLNRKAAKLMRRAARISPPAKKKVKRAS